MTGTFKSGVNKWEYIGHHIVRSSDLFLLCEQDRNDPESEPPFIARLFSCELYGMITFVLKRMREVDAEAGKLFQKAQSGHEFIPLEYRGREMQHFRMLIGKTAEQKVSELYNAEFIKDTDEGYETYQGVFVTLERALGFLFQEIGYRSGTPSSKFSERIQLLYPEYTTLITRNIEAARPVLIRAKTVPVHGSSVLKIHLSTEQLDELYNDLSKFFDTRDQEDLLLLLQGNESDRKLLFMGNQNRLAEVFRRLHYHRKITDSQTHLRNWLCHNFKYRSKSGESELSPNTVWDILTKAKGEPSSRSRICLFDWLQFKTHSAVKRSW